MFFECSLLFGAKSVAVNDVRDSTLESADPSFTVYLSLQ